MISSGLCLFCFIVRGLGYPNPLTPRGPVQLAAAKPPGGNVGFRDPSAIQSARRIGEEPKTPTSEPSEARKEGEGGQISSSGEPKGGGQ